MKRLTLIIKTEQDYQELHNLLEMIKKQHQIDLGAALESLEKDLKEAHEKIIKTQEEKWASDMQRALEEKDIVHMLP
jgi:hypothetical protein